jgi:hypothetical protein
MELISMGKRSVILLLCSLASSVAFGQENWQANTLFPDRILYKVGNWQIATAFYGVGCVASSKYDGREHTIAISGETPKSLTLLITTDAKQFNAKLDGSEDSEINSIEIALIDHRWSHVQAYGYRGTSGVVLGIDKQFLQSFARSKAIKVTERGYEKLRIELHKPNVVLGKLVDCFQRG